MAMNQVPRYKHFSAVALTEVDQAANTNRNGSGTITTILGSKTDPVEIENIVFKFHGTNSTMKITIFLYDGSAWHPVDEVDCAATATVDATNSSLQVKWTPLSDIGHELIVNQMLVGCAPTVAGTDPAETFSAAVQWSTF